MSHAEWNHDAMAALGKLRTILHLMKEADPTETKEQFLPMAEQCCADLKDVLSKIIDAEK